MGAFEGVGSPQYGMWGKQEQQRVAGGPGNVHFISLRQVLSDAAARQVRVLVAGPPLCSAAVYRQLDDYK